MEGKNCIYIVSGLPRSGTSMMMQILKANGFSLVVDNVRTPDEDNPAGYFEYEIVKELEKKCEWLVDACGKVLKVVSQWLEYLPVFYNYKIIFMERDLDEIILSQNKMLQHRSKTENVTSSASIKEILRKHLDKIKFWCQAQNNIEVCFCQHHSFFSNLEEEIDRLSQFLNRDLDIHKTKLVIRSDLYRNRIK